jgi:hypothetical protein
MPLTTFPNGISSFGMPVVGPLLTTGTVYFVNSAASNALNGNDGKSPDAPFATINGAFDKCSANDTIIVAAGHAETITAAAGIDADVRGVRVIGLGEGDKRPTITFTTATTADIDIDAADITFENMRFVCGIDSQVAMIDVNADTFTIKNCEFSESSATGLTCIDINGGAANACDRVKVQGCTFRCITAANWDAAIELGEVADGVEITGNVILGDFDDAGIHNPTGKVLTNLTIARNYVQNIQAGDHAIELVSNCTGFAFDNRLVTDAQATAFDAGALSCAGNLWNISTGGDSEGVPVNATGDAATNFIGADNNNNAVATTNVVANADGSVLERLEEVQQQLSGTTGIASFPAAAAAANNVSLAEVIRYIEDALVGTAGVVTYPSAAAAANAVSLAEVLRYVQDRVTALAFNRNSTNYLSVTADMTSATWNTVAAHEIATVTGAVRLAILPQCTGTLTSSGGSATLVLGDETTTDSLISSSDAENLATGEWWFDATMTRTLAIRSIFEKLDFVVANGKDIGYTIGTEALTGGSIVFHMWWEPIDATGSVAAGAGGVL